MCQLLVDIHRLMKLQVTCYSTINQHIVNLNINYNIFLCGGLPERSGALRKGICLRESHAVILRDRVVPASQVPFPGKPSGEPGNGT